MKELNKIIGKNLCGFREMCGFTQEEVAKYLEIQRGTFANYEAGHREAPMPVLIRLSNLYGVELGEFLNEDMEAHKVALTCAFRLEGRTSQDMETIAEFKDVVKSYLKMKRMQEDKDEK